MHSIIVACQLFHSCVLHAFASKGFETSVWGWSFWRDIHTHSPTTNTMSPLIYDASTVSPKLGQNGAKLAHAAEQQQSCQWNNLPPPILKWFTDSSWQHQSVCFKGFIPKWETIIKKNGREGLYFTLLMGSGLFSVPKWQMTIMGAWLGFFDQYRWWFDFLPRCWKQRTLFFCRNKSH